MQIKTHGGHCCGIKTIYSLGAYPTQNIMAEDTAAPGPGIVIPALQPDHYPDQSFFRGKRPLETYIQRITAYVEYIERERPAHLIEVTTSTACSQTSRWKPHLEELGFKVSAECKNSNSHQIVTIWHRVHNYIDNPKPKKKATANIRDLV